MRVFKMSKFSRIKCRLVFFSLFFCYSLFASGLTVKGIVNRDFHVYFRGETQTREPSWNKYCAKYQFTCESKECISKTSVCDGVLDCHDGSDEASIICGRSRTPLRTCTIPQSSPDRTYIVFDERGNRVSALPGDEVPQLHRLWLQCSTGSVMESGVNNSQSRCQDGWIPSVKNCIRSPALCDTPNSETGTCISIRSCPKLFNLLANDGRNPEVVSFLRKSQCGFQKNTPKVCCPSEKPSTLPTESSSPLPAMNVQSICGKSDVRMERLVGGRNSSAGDWPWMVGLGYTSPSQPELQFKCGATLISDAWVITAAHCVMHIGNWKLRVARLGAIDLSTPSGDGSSVVDVPIDDIKVHPEYRTNPQINDVALLRLKNKVYFNEFILPICLLSEDKYKGDNFYRKKRPFMIGWGAVQWKGAMSNKLQITTTHTYDNKECAAAYAQELSSLIDERVLCAGRPGVDSCRGDEGGPLMFPIGNRYFLGGIESYGIRCANPDFPVVYTKIAAFSNWITKNTGLNL